VTTEVEETVIVAVEVEDEITIEGVAIVNERLIFE